MTMIPTVANGRWMPTITSLALLAVFSGLVVYWAMQLLAPPVTIAPSGSLVNAEAAFDTSSSRTLFGTKSGKPALVERRASVKVEVAGIAASLARAAAILSIDGRPAAVYGVGQPINGDENFTVTRITATEVTLNRNGEQISVEVQSGGDLAVLTSGQNDSSATRAPTAGRVVQSPRRGARNRPGGAGRPGLQRRRLPPSGAAAAAAAAKNTTGIGEPNTPAAGRSGRMGSPKEQNRSRNGASKSQPDRTRIGTPASVTR